MEIRFRDINKPVDFQEDIPAFTLDLGYHYGVAVAPLTLDLTAEPTKRGYRIRGAFAFSASAPCSRCLATVLLSGKAFFDSEFRPAGNGAPKGEVEVPAGEEEVVFIQEDALDLETLVRQQLYLELPDKILCKGDCPGLCPHCGADLKAGPCACPKETDARWTLLPSRHPIS